MQSRELQDSVLRYLTRVRQPPSLGDVGRHGQGIQSELRLSYEPGNHQIVEAFWALLGRGLVFLDVSQPASSNWRICVSERGRSFVKNEDYNPQDPQQYIARLRREVPDLDPIVVAYLREAAVAFDNELYLSSTVMLGVAAEAAFLDMVGTFVETLSSADREAFEKVLQKKANFAGKVSSFREQLEKGPPLPSDLKQGIDTQYAAVQSLFRENRNEVGHPTGAMPDRDGCFTSLALAPRYLKRLCAMKAHFASLVRAR